MSKYGYIGKDGPTQAVKSNACVLTPKEHKDLVIDEKIFQAGQLEFIETISASGDSTIAFTSLGDYDIHFLTYNDLYNSNDSKGFALRLYESGVLETGSVYVKAHQDRRGDGSTAESRSTGTGQWQFTCNTAVGTHARSRTGGYFYFYNLRDSSQYSYATDLSTGVNNSNNFDTRAGSWCFKQTSYVDGIQVLAYDAGNMTGTFSLYGIKVYR